VRIAYHHVGGVEFVNKLVSCSNIPVVFYWALSKWSILCWSISSIFGIFTTAKRCLNFSQIQVHITSTFSCIWFFIFIYLILRIKTYSSCFLLNYCIFRIFTAPWNITCSWTLSWFSWNLKTHETRHGIFSHMYRILIRVADFFRTIFVFKSMNI